MDRSRLEAAGLADLFMVPIATGPVLAPTPKRPRFFWSLVFGLAVVLGSIGIVFGYCAVLLVS